MAGPFVLAAWLRWLSDDQLDHPHQPGLQHVATELERLGKRRSLRLEIGDLKIPAIVTKIEIARDSLEEAIVGPHIGETLAEQLRCDERLNYFVDRIADHVRELREASDRRGKIQRVG
jgi:hypothetical protein